MVGLVKHTVKETLKDCLIGEIITLTSEESSKIDRRINEAMEISRRDYAIRSAKSWEDAGRCYITF